MYFNTYAEIFMNKYIWYLGLLQNNKGEGTHKWGYGWNKIKISHELINCWNWVIGTWIFIIYYMLLYVIKHLEFKNITPLPYPQQKAKSPLEFMNSLLVFSS